MQALLKENKVVALTIDMIAEKNKNRQIKDVRDIKSINLWGM